MFKAHFHFINLSTTAYANTPQFDARQMGNARHHSLMVALPDFSQPYYKIAFKTNVTS